MSLCFGGLQETGGGRERVEQLPVGSIYLKNVPAEAGNDADTRAGGPERFTSVSITRVEWIRVELRHTSAIWTFWGTVKRLILDLKGVCFSSSTLEDSSARE